jgi:hypothetical protein
MSAAGMRGGSALALLQDVESRQFQVRWLKEGGEGGL